MLGDLLRLVRTEGPLQWELAVQLATSVAAGDDPDPVSDPLDRIRIEELVAIAELHVADVTGMVLAPGGHKIQVLPTTRVDWARRSLASWRPLLERLASALASTVAGSVGSEGAPGQLTGDIGPKASGTGEGAGSADSSTGPSGEASPGGPHGAELDDSFGLDDGFGALLGQWASAMAPAMAAMQVGSVVGHLARRTLGQYDLPLPRPGGEILVVPSNMAKLSAEWSLAPDDLRLWVVVHELAYHTVLGRAHVATRLEDLLVAHASLVRPDPRDLEGLLEHVDPSAIPGLAQLLGESPLAGDGPGPSAELERVQEELSALVSVVAGFAEHVTSVVAGRLIGEHAPIGEAMRRRRLGRGEGERVAESLFGLRLDQSDLDRGTAFTRGVLERSGEHELARLWIDGSYLPTPPEVDAPGLWLARINLPERDG